MNFLFFIGLLSCFVGVKFQKKEYWSDYMKREKTLAFSGVFVLLIFFHHFGQYIVLGTGDQVFSAINRMLRQLIVTPFLFYSGYGIMTSAMQKEAYIKKLPKRIAKVWIPFVVAVLLYYLVNYILGRVYPLKTLLLSFTGVISIGNSNWYIFAILIMYLLTLIAFIIAKNNVKKAAMLISGLCIGYILVLVALDFPTYFYDTILVYPMGLWFALYRSQVELWITAKSKRYYGLFFAFSALFVGLYLLRNYVVAYELLSMVFIAICVLGTMKIQMDNKWLRFLGQHTFEIYILQRIPMMLLHSCHLPTIVYFVLSFGITVVLAITFGKILDTLWCRVGLLN